MTKEKSTKGQRSTKHVSSNMNPTKNQL